MAIHWTTWQSELCSAKHSTIIERGDIHIRMTGVVPNIALKFSNTCTIRCCFALKCTMCLWCFTSVAVILWAWDIFKLQPPCHLKVHDLCIFIRWLVLQRCIWDILISNYEKSETKKKKWTFNIQCIAPFQIKYNKQLYSHNVEHFSKLCIYTWNVTWNLGDGVVLASAQEIL